MSRTSAPSKILRAFALQLVLISVATILGLLVTYWVVEDLLSQEALLNEAEHYWDGYAQDQSIPLPNTANLLGYLGTTDEIEADVQAGRVPRALADQPPGYGRVAFQGAEPLVLVSDRQGQRLYLVFAQERVSALTFYFGLVPLMLVLLVIYVLAFLTYRSSHQALSPFVALANYLEDFDSSAGASINLEGFRIPGNTEIDSLVDAVTHLSSGWEAALDREKVFTRDAGHELRTPVAVFKGSLDLLEHSANRPQHDLDAISRMRRTVAEMESLLNALLLLAREPAGATPTIIEAQTSLREVIDHRMAQLAEAAERKNVALQWLGDTPTQDRCVNAPVEVVDILVGNLLRNAINYTPAGQIEIGLQDSVLVVKDSGVGIPPQEVKEVFNAFFRGSRGRDAAPGHGLGLAIVKRIVDRYGWQVEVQSELGVGTEFRVDFG